VGLAVGYGVGKGVGYGVGGRVGSAVCGGLQHPGTSLFIEYPL